MTNPQVEIETRLVEAVNSFLDMYENSELVRINAPYAIVSRPGLSRSQVRNHLLTCLITGGVWVPVFACIAILRAPKMYLIDASDPAGIWSWELCDDDR